jgi:hypothetical protein
VDDRQAGGTPRLKPSGDIRGAMQTDQLERGGGKRGGIAFVTDHVPVWVDVRGLGDASWTLGVKPPLEVVPLDDNRVGDFAIAAPLKLGADVDHHAALLDRFEHFVRLKTSESRPRAAQQAVQLSLCMGTPPRGGRPGFRHVWSAVALHWHTLLNIDRSGWAPRSDPPV